MNSPSDQYDTFACHPLSDEAFRLTTVLTRAITCEAHHKMRYLLEKGCNPNGPAGRNEIRPLMVAAYVNNSRKQSAIFKCLLKHGADPMLCDVYGRNSIMYACALGLRDATQLMIKDSDYDLNATDMYGDTLLHFCAKTGNVQVLCVVLRAMLKHRMDISVQNHADLTPLSLAVLDGHYECAKILHQVGGSPRYLGCAQSNVLGFESNHDDIRIAWSNDIAISVRRRRGDVGARASVSSARNAVEKDLVQSETHPGPSLRRQRNVPKLFTRVRVDSASDLCKSHSGSKSATYRSMSAGAGQSSRVASRGGQEMGASVEVLQMAKYDFGTRVVSAGQKPDNQSMVFLEDTTRDDEGVDSTSPASSMDCINAILNSPACKRRLSSSFSLPSKVTSGVDSQWLAIINTYSAKVASYEETIASLPKVQSVHTSSRQKSSSSSSSASSSQSQLFRSKVLRHLMTSPLFFKTPLAKTSLQRRKDECRV